MHAAQDLLRHLLPTLAYAKQGWIFAYTYSVGGLLVYSSPLVKRHSNLFRPVADILGSEDYRLLKVQLVQDETMMFGEGILSVYKRAL